MECEICEGKGGKYVEYVECVEKGVVKVLTRKEFIKVHTISDSEVEMESFSGI